MAENNNLLGSPFDNRTVLVIVLMVFGMMGWNSYLAKKYPNANKAIPKVEESNEKLALNSAGGSNSGSAAKNVLGTQAGSSSHSDTGKTGGNVKSGESDSKILTGTSELIQEKLIQYEDSKVKFSVSNYGMGIKTFTLKEFSDRNGESLVFSGSEFQGLFSGYLGGELLIFELTEEGPGSYIGRAKNGETEFVRTLKYDPEKGAFENKISITKFGEGKSVEIRVPEKIKATGSGSSMFSPSAEKQDFFINGSDGKTKTITFSTAKENLSENFQTTNLIGVSSQYFTAAVLDKSEIIPTSSVKTNLDKKEALAAVKYSHPGGSKTAFELNEVFYIGPKSIDKLKKVDSELAEIIDFGTFGFIAKPLLYLMKSLHEYVGNWGLAIIFLTLIVRLFVMPFNIMSYKSMKAMQKIQPVLQGLREKYKDDPVALNKEMYALMKENKANPMGGCLPMLLQIPVFFALYRVIGSSVELYKSPFFGWISDLSAHDPFYILPVLMGVTMFVQQKITPSTMDPAQAKIMLFMPIIFSFFMIQLPSGLTLYMLISGLFGITQQFIFMHDRKKSAILAEI